MHRLSRTLHPTAIVNAWLGLWLDAGFRVIIPAVIKKYKNGLDLIIIRDMQVFVHALFKSFGICLPGNIVKENTNGIETDLVRPAQFALNGRFIKGCCLPHFQFIDGGTGYKITADNPALMFVPVVRFFGSPYCRVLCACR